jgi:hypothetical protein
MVSNAEMNNNNHHYGGIESGFDSLAHLLPKVRQRTKEHMTGYTQSQVILENIGSYIVSPGLGNPQLC